MTRSTKNGGFLNISSSQDISLLISQSSLSEFQQLLSDHPEWASQYDQFLKLSVQFNRLDLLQHLHHHAMRFDQYPVGPSGDSLLILAIRQGHFPIVQWLIQQGAPVNACHSNQYAPLFLAATFGFKKIFNTLIRSGADPYQSFTGLDPIHHLLETYLDGVPALIKSGISLENLNEKKQTPLMVAASMNHPVFKLILDQGVNIEAKDDQGWTALMHAAQSGNHQNIELLLHHGADVNVTSSNGSSALLLAASHYSYLSIELLLNAGADLFLRDSQGRTPLMIAITKMDTKIIQLLLDHSDDSIFDDSHQDYSGQTVKNYIDRLPFQSFKDLFNKKWQAYQDYQTVHPMVSSELGGRSKRL